MSSNLNPSGDMAAILELTYDLTGINFNELQTPELEQLNQYGHGGNNHL